MSEDVRHLYPDLEAHGSLGCLIRAALEPRASAASVRGFEEDGWSRYWATVERGRRQGQITVVTTQRLFTTTLWDRGVAIASVATASFDVMVEALVVWFDESADSTR